MRKPVDKPNNRAVNPHTRYRAFTLIEVLTVVGIIAILVTLVVLGVGHISKVGREKSTHITMGNLKNLMAEYELTVGGFTRQPPYMWFTNGTTPPTMAIDIWKDGIPGNAIAIEPVYAPRNVTIAMAFPLAANSPRYASDAVANTQLVMGMLSQVPKNKTVLSQFPSSQFMEAVPAVPSPLSRTELTVGAGRAAAPPVVLDGWGNPIIFCPAGGLSGQGASTAANPDSMWIGGKPGDPSAKAIVWKAGGALAANEIPPIQSPDHRPFWASAGPDGNFCTADDNIYSFEAQ
jgi:prepilin-type N-terminal cleavage/methylation domain-containing protein